MAQSKTAPVDQTGAAVLSAGVDTAEDTAKDTSREVLSESAVTIWRDLQAKAMRLGELYQRNPAAAIASYRALRDHRLFAREMSRAAFSFAGRR